MWSGDILTKWDNPGIKSMPTMMGLRRSILTPSYWILAALYFVQNLGLSNLENIWTTITLRYTNSMNL